MVIYFFQHTPHEHPGQLIHDLDYYFAHSVGTLSIRVLHLYQFTYNEAKIALNFALTKGDFFVSLGGPMSANDEDIHPWIALEIQAIQNIIFQNKKFLGICLGAQLLARALGSRVTKNPLPEIGWHSIQIDPSLSDSTENYIVYQWHYDTFELPQNCVRLFTSKTCENQGFFLNSSTGTPTCAAVQFHPEVDEPLLHDWLSHADSRYEITESIKKFGGSTIQTIEQQKYRCSFSDNQKITKLLIELLLRSKMSKRDAGSYSDIQRPHPHVSSI